MTHTGIISLILIVITAIVSYKGFTNPSFFEQYKFQVEKVLVNREYYRLLTSGFLHVSWIHLVFNMISLFLFSGLVEGTLGGLNFLIIYGASLVGGGLLSLMIHRYEGGYTSVGASGAVCGIMFASVVLYPGMGIGFFLIPLFIPNYIYAVIFVLYSIYGIRSRKDNVGHDAHLGGALVGMTSACVMAPEALLENYWIVLIIAAPIIVFIYLIANRPHLLFVNKLFKPRTDYYSIDHKFNADRSVRQQEVDRILE